MQEAKNVGTGGCMAELGELIIDILGVDSAADFMGELVALDPAQFEQRVSEVLARKSSLAA